MSHVSDLCNETNDPEFTRVLYDKLMEGKLSDEDEGHVIYLLEVMCKVDMVDLAMATIADAGVDATITWASGN